MKGVNNCKVTVLATLHTVDIYILSADRQDLSFLLVVPKEI